MLHLVNDGPAALWAIVELNLWVVVATIPALRPLVTRAIQDIRDRSSTYRSKTDGYHKKSMKGVMGRLWPSKNHSSNPSDGHLPFDGVEPAIADLCPSGRTYNVEISAPATNGSGWTPLGTALGGKNHVELSNLDGIRVNQEFELSGPPKTHLK